MPSKTSPARPSTRTSARTSARASSRASTRPAKPSLPARKAIHSDAAPAAIGPYSQAIGVGRTLWMSGQIALDPATMQIVEGGIEAQAVRVLDNMRAVLAAAGGSLDDIVKLTILLTDIADFGKVNELMAAVFTAPYPARSTYQVAALPRGSRLEVEAVALLPA